MFKYSQNVANDVSAYKNENLMFNNFPFTVQLFIPSHTIFKILLFHLCFFTTKHLYCKSIYFMRINLRLKISI